MSNLHQNLCPHCQNILTWVDEKYHCDSCNLNFNKQAYCEQCGAQLEKLKACGAVSYFCNQCNELKSRSRAKIVFVPAE